MVANLGLPLPIPISAIPKSSHSRGRSEFTLSPALCESERPLTSRLLQMLAMRAAIAAYPTIGQIPEWAESAFLIVF